MSERVLVAHIPQVCRTPRPSSPVPDFPLNSNLHGPPFDGCSSSQDGFTTPQVHIGRREVRQTLVIPVIVVVLEPDAILQRLMPFVSWLLTGNRVSSVSSSAVPLATHLSWMA